MPLVLWSALINIILYKVLYLLQKRWTNIVIDYEGELRDHVTED